MKCFHSLSICLILSLCALAQDASNQGSTSAGVIDGNDPLLQPAPLPPGKPSLIGGNIVKVDQVRSTMVVRPFGGKDMKIFFDDRTHIFRDGVETTQLGLRKQDRVYVDTLLDGGHVFAKNIRVETGGRLADARGSVVRLDRARGRLSIVDRLSQQPVDLSLDSRTEVRRGEQPAALSDLVPGSLIAVEFAPGAAGRGIARQITIYATPGSVFTFAGRLTFLDMKSGVLALANQSDSRNYEIHFDPQANGFQNLGMGYQVTIDALFDGSQYKARNVTVDQAAAQ